MANRGETPTRHYDEKLEEILKCAAKIFAEKGFHSTSIRDISRATGMSLAGLYYYFRTKEELLFLIQERCILTLLQRWETVNPDKDARTRVRLFAE
ncbi:MAG TPA: helix-turn-helix domain-containing protein, partial [Candidatus Binatia bacterium]